MACCIQLMHIAKERLSASHLRHEIKYGGYY